ncbi:MAG: hypothetical protein PWP34_1628 [Desulfuromonadales bacterium]|jgi:hypothetical protein|nr:hypothetical protein [Desulfuromonadales bacterium]
MNSLIHPESEQQDTIITFVLKSKQTKTDQRGQSRVSQPPAGNLPRITKLMALAIRFESLVSRGEVQDYADLARLGYVTRARITQIMNLLNLAPDIQEALLFLPRITSGRDMFREKELRSIAQVPYWNRQRKMWTKLKTDKELASQPPIIGSSES